jgi:hypothetical protein
VGWYYGNLARVLHHRLAGEEALALATALRYAIGDIAEHKGCEMFRAGSERGARGELCPNGTTKALT